MNLDNALSTCLSTLYEDYKNSRFGESMDFTKELKDLKEKYELEIESLQDDLNNTTTYMVHYTSKFNEVYHELEKCKEKLEELKRKMPTAEKQ